jgi:carboxyl-terminal processing protease
MSFRKLTLSLFFGVLMLNPLAAFARPVTEIVDTSQSTVTRANFLTWTLQVLDYPREADTCTLPYKRVPRGMRATLCTAQAHNVLNVFGTSQDYVLAKPITRGEALMVLTDLLDKSETADVSGFKDVVGNDQKQAVMNAVALKWMLPVRSALFGVARPLTAVEALSLLEAVSGQTGARYQESITINLPQSSTALPREDLISAIWQLINRDYLRSDKIDQDEAAYRAIEGIVDSLKDPYTTFFRPVTANDFQSQIKGEVSGIGAQIEEKSGEITVVAPLPGSPAERAGISAGDVILEAGGVTLTGLGVEKAVSYIRGERGTSVVLKIRRGGGELTVTVQRDIISIPEISTKWQGDIAVVQLVQFGQTTENQIRTVFTDIVAKNPHGIILDLRNNGGGLLAAADTVASNFVPKGTVVAKVQSRTETTEEKTDSDPTVDPATKLVILVNKGSASASEIVAGALQDLGRATIVGTQTFGKGTVQEVIGFRTGEAMKITIAEWLTPLGRKLEGVGVKPDIIIESTDRDAQLQRALDILR